MSQSARIAQHLRKGHTLTAIEALEKFRCFRLAARIQDLKDAGLPIHSVRVTRGNKTFARYYMACS